MSRFVENQNLVGKKCQTLELSLTPFNVNELSWRSAVKQAQFVMCSLVSKYQVSAFYQFVEVASPETKKAELENYLKSTSILGTVLVAGEGVNGTISGPTDELEQFFDFLKKVLGVDELPYKVAFCETQPFHRMKVKLKKEIVTLGIEGIDPLQQVGEYVEAEDWNELIGRDDVLLVDTRNDYEYAVGTFEGAVNPNTKNFREFPDYVDREMSPDKTPNVAMFCTGGIRCEKATALMLKKGFKNVYHLNGGILEYFNRIPEEKSTWSGECFVFDERVTVNQNLEQGSYEMCHACRMPLSEEETKSEHYVKGVSCEYCHDKTSADKKERLQQRNLQMQLAKEREEKHLGQPHPRHLQIDSDEIC